MSLAHQLSGRISTSIVRFWRKPTGSFICGGGDEAVRGDRSGASNEGARNIYAGNGEEDHVDASGRDPRSDGPDNETVETGTRNMVTCWTGGWGEPVRSELR